MNRIAKKLILMTALALQFATVASSLAQTLDGPAKGTILNPTKRLEETMKQGPAPLVVDPAQAVDPKEVINGADQCFYQYQWLCTPYGCSYRYVYVCFPTLF